MKTFTQFFFEDNLPKDGQWITAKSGKHIFLSKDGKMLAGVPKELIGKDVSQLKDIDRYLDKSTPKAKNINNVTDFKKAVDKSVTEKEAHDFCKVTKASDDSWNALHKYCDDDYMRINESLRRPEIFKTLYDDSPEVIKEISEIVNNIRKIFDENRTTKDVTVYRGLTSGRRRLESLSPGDIFNDKGFISTSSSLEIADDFSGGTSRMKILVPKGSRAISTSEITKFPNEEEILLGDNSNLKFVGLDDDGETYCFQVVN